MSLSIESVCKKYGDKVALTSFSYQFHTGVYGLLGPNGAGKSTLIQILQGSLKPDSGNILYDGKRIDLLGKSYRRELGIVPQKQTLYDNYSLEEFLVYIAILKEVPRNQIDLEVKNAIEAVNMSKNANQKIGTFSGGMKQRTLLAQAILGGSRILLLDEPTSGLDPMERVRLRNLIAELSKQRIVLLATHVVSDVETIANDILILKNGELLCSGSPRNISNQICGRVYEKNMDENEYDIWRKNHIITNVTYTEQGFCVRYISEEDSDEVAEKVSPHLDDYYLYLFNRVEENEA